jgi:hypothetical protein
VQGEGLVPTVLQSLETSLLAVYGQLLGLQPPYATNTAKVRGRDRQRQGRGMSKFGRCAAACKSGCRVRSLVFAMCMWVALHVTCSVM